MRRTWTPALLVLAVLLGGLCAWWLFADRGATRGGFAPGALSPTAPAAAHRSPEVDPRVAAASAAAKASSTSSKKRLVIAGSDAALGSISGTVRRPDGSPVAKVKVTAREEGAAAAAPEAPPRVARSGARQRR